MTDCGVPRWQRCFNSLMVRLEVPVLMTDFEMKSSFNSLMVRLEVTANAGGDPGDVSFQFLNGAIGSALGRAR